MLSADHAGHRTPVEQSGRAGHAKPSSLPRRFARAPGTAGDGAVTGPRAVPAKTLRITRRLVREQVRSLGDRLVEWRTDRSLRFTDADRFGHELPDRKEMLRRAWHYACFNRIEGDYAEFGCHGAFTFRMAWHAMELVGTTARLWGFDSFAGLPEQVDRRDGHPRWMAGTMATSVERFHQLCARAGMTPDRYVVVEGLYHETLQSHASDPRPGLVAVAYVDCDLYSSTVDVLQFLETRLRPGSVIAFDDYFCTNPDGPSGERRAALEHFATSTWQLVPYVQFGWAGMSFVVEPRGGPEVGRPITAGP